MDPMQKDTAQSCINVTVRWFYHYGKEANPIISVHRPRASMAIG